MRLARASGKPLSQLAAERITGPLGMAATSFGTADGGAPVLTAGSVALMTADALTGAQRQQALPIVGPGGSWGLATGVDVEAAGPEMAPGRWGWDGGTGTTAHVDPTRGTVGVLLTQRMMTGPLDGFGDFWAAVAAAA